MISCGSFSFGGNANASPSACERERMSLFKFSCSVLCCRRRRRRRRGSVQTTCLLPCRGAASIPGTHSICEVGSALGWVARGVGEVRKVGSQLRSPLSLDRGETQDFAYFFSNSKETHPPCHPKSAPCTWTETVPQASGLLRLPEDLLVSSERSAGAFPKSSGTLRAQRRRWGLSREPLGRQADCILELQPGESPLGLHGPYLTSVTCRLRHQMSVLR